MHKVWRYLGLRNHRLGKLQILRHEAAMIRAIVVPVKHGMEALMIALKEAEINAEATPVNMH